MEYIAEVVFRVILNIDVRITTDQKQCSDSSAFIINYSDDNFPETNLTIIPHGLLFETDIREQSIEINEWRNRPIFFATNETELPFDLLSAAFYLVSRYEEYLPYTPDRYQRYPANDSLAFKHNFLTIPLVDIWVMELKNLIESTSTTIQLPIKPCKFLPTYDIDIAYSYLGKGWKRNAGGLLRDLFTGKISKVTERIKVLTQQQKDPYDSLDFLDALHDTYHLAPVYFFLLSRGGPFDKNNAVSHPLMQTLLAKTSNHYAVGIHPSYQSNDNKEILKQEISLLNTTKSRQHYIRFNVPTTYRNLLELGITEDYSMGYGSTNGFRASTSHPHRWFDIASNEMTALTIYPFSFMECNSYFEQHFSVDEAFQEMIHYADITAQVGGTFISIWHNFSVGSDPMWKGWKEMYEMFWERQFIALKS